MYNIRLFYNELFFWKKPPSSPSEKTTKKILITKVRSLTMVLKIHINIDVHMQRSLNLFCLEQ